PARVLRYRGKGRRDEARLQLEALGDRAARDWRDVLARNFDGTDFVSRENDNQARKSNRHLCDAIEIAAGFGELPPGLDRDATLARLQAVQDPVTGLFPDPYQPPKPGVAMRDDGLALYNVLSTGYAIEVLGGGP